MAPRISEPVDLTTLDSSDEDDCRIIEPPPRAPAAGDSQPRKARPYSGSKHNLQSEYKTYNALTPRQNLGDAAIDLRSDSGSPGSKPRPKEKAVNGSHLSSTKLDESAARLSTPLGNVPRSVSKQSGPNNHISSGDDELPPVESIRGSWASSRPSSQRKNPSDSFDTMNSRPKRPFDDQSSSPGSSRPLKRTKVGGSLNGKPLPKELSDAPKGDDGPFKRQTNGLSPLSRSSSIISQQNGSLIKAASRNPVADRNGRAASERGPSSPAKSQNSQKNALPKRSDPIADLHASQEKRSARQQAASQESDNTVRKMPNEVTSTPIRPPKRRDSQSASTPPTQREPNGQGTQTNIEPRRARQSSLDRGNRPSAERISRVAQPGNEKANSEQSRALSLLNERSSSREKPFVQDRPVESPVNEQKHSAQSLMTGEQPQRTDRRQVSSPSAPSARKEKDAASAAVDREPEGDKNASKIQRLGKGSAVSTDASVNGLNGHLEKQKTVNAVGDPQGATEVEEVRTGSVNASKSGAQEEATPNGHLGSSDMNMSQHGEKGTAAGREMTNGVHPQTEDSYFEAATEAADADNQLQSEALRAQSDPIFAVPQSAASTLKSTAAYDKLPLATKVEKALGQYLEELAKDNEYGTSNSLRRARLSKESDIVSQAMKTEKATSFGHLKPLKLTPWQKTDSRQLTWGIERMSGGKPTSSERVTVLRQTFTSNTRDVPPYAHYVSIKSNFLAQNSKFLHCWPYFGDEFDNAQAAASLSEQYHLDIEGREQKLLRLRQAQKYEDYVESALADLDCSWSDVLRFLLEPNPDVGDNTDAMSALANREDFCMEDFDRDSRRWVRVLSSLPKSDPHRLARAAVLCENFQKLARFPLWHIARRSEFCSLPSNTHGLEDLSPASDELTCRICMRFNCPYHGELNERSNGDDEDDDSDSSDVSVVATDLVHPPKANYRTRVAFPAAPPLYDESDDTTSKPEKKDLRYWQNFQNQADARGPFYPCSHPGKSCDDEDADCSCYAENLPCEKFCGCDKDCSRKFQGCSCSTQRIKGGKRGPCFQDDRCTCWQLGRECDPDLCGGCGVCEVVDPVNKHDESCPRGRCQNASIQRGMPKCTLLGDSGVHGLGLYACENIHHHEFVGEYKGEIITKEEAERRGAVYEFQRLSYLFSLNKDQEIDSTYFGTKIRFINHAGDAKANLYPRIIMVNTVHRIALYAARNIRKGEELLFNYGPKFPDEQLGGKESKTERKSAPHVRNANLVKDFYDIEDEEDELGNRRAKGVSKSIGGRRNKQPKPRGGARPGAGRKPKRREVDLPPAVEPETRREQTPSEYEFTGQDAGQRLAAYNVADDRASDQMEVDDEAMQGAEDDDDEEYQESNEDEESEESGEEESSEDETGEGSGMARLKPGRRGKRSSWRS